MQIKPKPKSTRSKQRAKNENITRRTKKENKSAELSSATLAAWSCRLRDARVDPFWIVLILSIKLDLFPIFFQNNKKHAKRPFFTQPPLSLKKKPQINQQLSQNC
ncbi:hypothetical protein RCS94_00685 [Orbaceae bacterium ac157xtp]